jgi:hypothetical protein
MSLTSSLKQGSAGHWVANASSAVAFHRCGFAGYVGKDLIGEILGEISQIGIVPIELLNLASQPARAIAEGTQGRGPGLGKDPSYRVDARVFNGNAEGLGNFLAEPVTGIAHGVDPSQDQALLFQRLI